MGFLKGTDVSASIDRRPGEGSNIFYPHPAVPLKEVFIEMNQVLKHKRL